MADSITSESDGDSLKTGRIAEFAIEPPNEPPDDGSSIFDFLSSRDASGTGGSDTGRSGSGNSEGSKRRGRPKGTKNGTRSFTAKATKLSDNIGDKVAEIAKLIGNQGHKMYGPYGEFWEFSELELGFISGISDNIAKDSIGTLDDMGLRTTLIVGGVGLAVMFGFRGWQSYQLTKALKVAAERQAISYQGSQQQTMNHQQQAQQRTNTVPPSMQDNIPPKYTTMEDFGDIVNTDPAYSLAGIANE